MLLEPIKNSVIFAFEENVSRGRFMEQSQSGIFLGADHQREANAPRWGKVLAVGPDATVKKGSRILIEPMQWTYGIEHDGIKIWRTTEDKILCVE